MVMVSLRHMWSQYIFRRTGFWISGGELANAIPEKRSECPRVNDGVGEKGR